MDFNLDVNQIMDAITVGDAIRATGGLLGGILLFRMWPAFKGWLKRNREEREKRIKAADRCIEVVEKLTNMMANLPQEVWSSVEDRIVQRVDDVVNGRTDDVSALIRDLRDTVRDSFSRLTHHYDVSSRGHAQNLETELHNVHNEIATQVSQTLTDLRQHLNDLATTVSSQNGDADTTSIAITQLQVLLSERIDTLQRQLSSEIEDRVNEVAKAAKTKPASFEDHQTNPVRRFQKGESHPNPLNPVLPTRGVEPLNTPVYPRKQVHWMSTTDNSEILGDLLDNKE